MGVSPWRGVGRWTVLLGVFLSLQVIGCGPSTGSVSGKVFYKDAPLKGGTVTFVTPDKKIFSAEIGEDGSYSIVGKIPAGDVKIAVNTESLKPQPGVRSYGPPPGAENLGGYKPPDSAAAAKRYIKIPEKYADPEASGLKYTVTGGKQEFDIKLVD